MYTANGEASDYMLAERGIFAVSPELGTSDNKTMSFFIKDQQALVNLVQKNYQWIIFTIE